jgi:DNA-binding transcriptional MocR family regulator
MSPKQTARQTADELGIDFRTVQDAYDCLKERDREEKGRKDEVRQVAWSFATNARRGYSNFWRHGFRARWGQRYDLGDATNVPRYDLIHQVVASQFPEWDYAGGECDLMDFLMSPREPFASAADLWQEAIEWALAEQTSEEFTDEEEDELSFNFGALADSF